MLKDIIKDGFLFYRRLDLQFYHQSLKKKIINLKISFIFFFFFFFGNILKNE